MRRRGSSPWSFVNKDDYMSDSGEEHVPAARSSRHLRRRPLPRRSSSSPLVQQVASRKSPARLADTASLQHLVLDDVFNVGCFATVAHVTATRRHLAAQKGR
ncbi:hypothetical protein MRX96_042116 [Rhipicephalus microplus]